MGKWAILLGGCWWLLRKQVAATTNAAVTNAAVGNVGTTQAMADATATTAMVVNPLADYTPMGSPHGACRTTPRSSSGRVEAEHAITSVSNAEECAKFCNHIKPCWGFEFDPRPQHFQPGAKDYGNCEIWKKKIGEATSDQTYRCYKKTVDPNVTVVEMPTVSADFKITNLNLTAMLSNSTLLVSLATEMFPIVNAYLNTTVMSVIPSASNPEVKISGSDLMLRFVFTPVNDTHSARLHNYVRLLGSPKKKVHGGFNLDVVFQDPEAGLPETIASYFQGLTDIVVGQVVVTMEKATLTPLAGALQGQALAAFGGNNPGGNNPGGNNPGGNNPGGGNPGGSTTKRSASSGYACVPLLFLVLLCLPKI